jgi:hypothetical protein
MLLAELSVVIVACTVDPSCPPVALIHVNSGLFDIVVHYIVVAFGRPKCLNWCIAYIK